MNAAPHTAAPLAGVRVLEFRGRGAAPFAAMLLADLGADVVQVANPSDAVAEPSRELVHRGRRRLELDLKDPDESPKALALARAADVLIEGFRPGVMERLGLGPERCLAENRTLIYGRMTGWGQEGTLRERAGHDINFIALSGALHMVGRDGGPPTPPVNFVGDFAGGMLMAIGVLSALWESKLSGEGQIVDASMLDAAAILTTAYHGHLASGGWLDERGVNRTDSGAHFYETYECADGKYLAVGAIESKFYRHLLEQLGIDDTRILEGQNDRANWPRHKDILKQRLRQETRAHWLDLLEGVDCCVAPVLSLTEAPKHHHNVSRGTFVDVDGIVQPASVPRYSRSVLPQPAAPPSRSLDSAELVLATWNSQSEPSAKHGRRDDL
jgi:alpha-methylacyl-CoA racemase